MVTLRRWQVHSKTDVVYLINPIMNNVSKAVNEGYTCYHLLAGISAKSTAPAQQRKPLKYRLLAGSGIIILHTA